MSPSDELEAESLTKLAQYIADFGELSDQYGRVPQVGREIKSALAKQRNRPQVQSSVVRARRQTTVGRCPGAGSAGASLLRISAL